MVITVQNKPSDSDLNSKFDLDKVEIPAPSVDEETPHSQESEKQEASQETIVTKEPKSQKKIYLMPTLVAACFVILLSVLWLTNVVKPPGADQKTDSSGFDELYSKIGPIRVNSEKTQLSLTLTVKCTSPAAKEKIAGMDTIINERLVSFLSDPYTHQIIVDRDYNRLKIKIKTLLNDALGKTLIEDVYLAEIMLY